MCIRDRIYSASLIISGKDKILTHQNLRSILNCLPGCTNCQRDQILASDPRKKRLHKPQCNKDGSFLRIQTKQFNGDQLFWCVDKIYGIRKGHFTSNKKRLRCYKEKEGIYINFFVHESRSEARYCGGERFLLRKKLSLNDFAVHFNFNTLVNLNSFNFAVRDSYTKIICSDSKFPSY